MVGMLEILLFVFLILGIVLIVVLVIKKNNQSNFNSMENNSTNQKNTNPLGSWSSQGNTPNDRQQIIINQNGQAGNPNGIGTAGFVLALISLLVGWLPGVGWVCWLLGLIFSCVGMGRTPKGLAIAGLIISAIGLVVIIALTGAGIALVSEIFN